MTTQMTATEVKAKLLSVLDAVAAGDEIEITRHGRTVARLVPATGPSVLRGRLAGVAMSAAGDEELFSTGATWDLP
jgi:prevent-host-death family protein